MKNRYHLFKKKSRVKAPIEEVFAWHARQGAIERLSPPFDPLQVLERSGGIHKGDKVAMKMKAGPIPYTWRAEHTDFKLNKLFRDVQLHGPFKFWRHSHLFEPDGTEACFLEDAIEFGLPFAPFGDILISGHVQKKLKRIFNYRHNTLCSDIYTHRLFKNQKRKKILISGASGLLGNATIPFLTTGGHQVVRLVRKLPLAEKNELFWDPEKRVIDPRKLSGLDAVIHLSGENIGQHRWTEGKKKKIVESRINSTNFLADILASLDQPPNVFICASATGFYGNRGNTLLTEKDQAGHDFISSVCVEWEKAALPAVQKGIRTVFIRLGIVLTPAGGALASLILPARLFLGGKIGTGNQYMSWISIEDVIGAVYHTLMNPTIEGPVNMVSPNPVSNLTMIQTIGQVINRPAKIPVPEWLVRLVFGQMGKELLLSSTRAIPQKLLDTGFRFRYPDLKEALTHLLGK